MISVESRDGLIIRLTDACWRHIVDRHPEMNDELNRIEVTIKDPDLIQEGDYGARLAVRLFEKTTLTSKHLVVVYRATSEREGFVITAYLTSRPAEWRQTVWKR